MSEIVGPPTSTTSQTTNSLPLSLTEPTSSTTPSAQTDTLPPRDFSDRITHAFQLATAQGPMCHEPIQGVAVILESLTLAPDTTRVDLPRLTGETIRTLSASLHAGFMDWSPRLMLAMYSCEIQASGTQQPQLNPLLPQPSPISSPTPSPSSSKT